MEVHVGEEHTNTFEIFKCYKCDWKERSINASKKHTEKQHGSSDNNKLHHMKMDRNKSNEVSDKVDYFDEILIRKSMPQENWNSITKYSIFVTIL